MKTSTGRASLDSQPCEQSGRHFVSGHAETFRRYEQSRSDTGMFNQALPGRCGGATRGTWWMNCTRCGSADLVGKVNGVMLCFDCYVEERPERPPFLPYQPVDEQRAQWAAWIAEGKRPVVVATDEIVGTVGFDDLLRRTDEDTDR